MERHISIPGGTLTCREQGGRVELCMDLHPEEKGLYRGFVWGKHGRLDLGTLLPEEDGLRLCRTLTVGTLCKAGCWPVIGGRAELTYAFSENRPPPGWRPCRDPAALFPHDPLLADAAGKLRHVLQKTTEPDGFQLSVPYDPACPFPLVPLFCFAQVRAFSGRLRAVFCFAPEGVPRMPPAEEPCQNPKSAVQ